MMMVAINTTRGRCEPSPALGIKASSRMAMAANVIHGQAVG
jgi:hypothetical protein